MVVMIPEEGSFTLTANVTAPGYQSVIPSGLLFSRRDGELWVAPLIPQLFYGADGEPLTTWRQYLHEPGEQVILSRVAGEPSVPREELWWRKISDRQVAELEAVEYLDAWTVLSDWLAGWMHWMSANYVWVIPAVAVPVVAVFAWDYLRRI